MIGMKSEKANSFTLFIYFIIIISVMFFCLFIIVSRVVIPGIQADRADSNRDYAMTLDV